MIKFTVDFQKWVLWLLPQVLRQPKNIAFLNALIAPIKYLHANFLNFRNDVNNKAQTTGQVCILRNYLNKKFDADLKRIYISDDIVLPPTYVYIESENRPLYLPVFLSQSGGSDFVVHTPNALMAQEIKIKAAVNYFKLPTKIYRIEYF